jgi:hypothetical protein
VVYRERASVRTAGQIQFDLTANARDSLKRTVDLLAWKDIEPEHSRLKHAIANAAHAIELLLKERLRRIHPAFIWEHVDKYPNLEARTVTVDTAISRLKNIGGVRIVEGDEKIIRSLRKTRNAIEHYEWFTTKKEAHLIIGNALSFAFSFALDQLGIDLADEFKGDDTWRLLIEELNAFVRAHSARIEAKIRERGDCSFYCAACSEQTVSSRSGRLRIMWSLAGR